MSTSRLQTPNSRMPFMVHTPTMFPTKPSSPSSQPVRSDQRPTLPPKWINPDRSLQRVEEEWKQETKGLMKLAQKECLIRAECLAIADPLADISRKLSSGHP